MTDFLANKRAYWKDQIRQAKNMQASPMELSMAVAMFRRTHGMVNFDLERPECRERLRDAQEAEDAISNWACGAAAWD